MAIRKWHPGKLIILWCWGLAFGTFALTDFQSRPIGSAPQPRHIVELFFLPLLLLGLTAVTWHWLGGREKSLDAPPAKELKDDLSED